MWNFSNPLSDRLISAGLSLYLNFLFLEFNSWMSELDKRYRKKVERNSMSTPSKPRVLGEAATTTPPAGAPKWAVQSNWKSGKYT